MCSFHIKKILNALTIATRDANKQTQRISKGSNPAQLQFQEVSHDSSLSGHYWWIDYTMCNIVVQSLRKEIDVYLSPFPMM